MEIKNVKENFEYLGREFEIKLVKLLLTDEPFAKNIINKIKPLYFTDSYVSLIVTKIIDYYNEYNVLPDFKLLKLYLKSLNLNSDLLKLISLTLKEIYDIDIKGCDLIKKSALNFCNQQSLKIGVEKIIDILESGDFNRYPECEEIIRNHMSLVSDKNQSINVFTDIKDVLRPDFRRAIPTGIDVLDLKMNGGLAPGELAVILAAYGVGKTTFFTVVANSAKNYGKKVLQIFFEDKIKVIQRKHFLRWYNLTVDNPISFDEIDEHRDDIIKVVENEMKKDGELILMKLPSNGVTISMIKQEVIKLINDGFKPDVLILDYIDCVSPPHHIKDQNIADGFIMREFETFISEYNIAGWTAVQGNRSAIDTSLVQGQQMGGSIKRGQIGHFVASIGKDLVQRENGLATIAILKSRFGPDGLVFPDCVFDNKKMLIEITDNDGLSFIENKKNKVAKAEQTILEIFDNKKKNK